MICRLVALTSVAFVASIALAVPASGQNIPVTGRDVPIAGQGIPIIVQNRPFSGRDMVETDDLDLLESAIRMMRSAAPEVRAWGAHLAGRQQLAAAIPTLRTLLHPPGADTGDDVKKELKKGGDLDLVRHAALHALIVLDAGVPAEELLPLPARFNAQVFLLLARDVEKNRAALLEFGDPDRSGVVALMAVGNILVPERSPGLAALFLRSLELKLGIWVCDEGRFYGGGSFGSRCGDGIVRNARGFPPLVRYELHARRKPDARIVAPGKFPVYCRQRTVAPGQTVGYGTISSDRKRNKYLLHSLARLAGIDEPVLDFDPEQNKSVVWTDAAGLRTAIAGARARMTGELHELARLFIERGLLTEDEKARLDPPVEVKVRDKRENPAEPLPDCSDLSG